MKVRQASYPIYAADGHRLRSQSQESIERLESLKLVLVQRNRRGLVVSAHYFGQTRSPLQARLKAGTRYSFREPVGDFGRRIWALEPLPWKAMDAQLEHLAQPEVVDSHVKALFQQVGLSCIAKPPRNDNVVSIDSGRRKLARVSEETLAA